MDTSHTSPDQIKFDYPIRNFLSNFGTKKSSVPRFQRADRIIEIGRTTKESRNPIHVSITADETEIYF